jgi:hypothetical protein
VANEVELLQKIYAAFNRREIETVLPALAPDVDWPNGMEGGRVLGRNAVLAYWTRQFGMMSPRVDPISVRTEPDGRIAMDVHQVVHDLTGNLLSDQMVQHVYTFREGAIVYMEIR